MVSGSVLKDILKNLCCNNGWSYGVFWSYNQQNSLLLTLQDAYCDDQTRVLIDDMILRVHKLGEEVIGRAAFTLKHQFIYSYAHNNKQNSTGSTEGFEVYQDNLEFFSHFLGGIKTILVIPVEKLGVVQFGSFQKLSETMDFVEQTKALFSEMGNGGLISNEDILFSSNSEILSSSASFPSYISSDNSWSATYGYLQLPCEEQQMEAEPPLTNLIWPFPSTSFDEKIDPIDNQFNFDGCISNIPLQQTFLPASSSVDNVIEIASCSQNSIDSEPWMYSTNGTLQRMASHNFYGVLFQDDDITNKLPQLLVPDRSNMFSADTLNNQFHDSEYLSSNGKGHTKKVSECSPPTSVQSSISNVFTTIENNKHSAKSGIQNLLDYSGKEIGCRSINLSDFISRRQVDNSGGRSKCFSRPTTKLFSSLGINHLSDDVSSSSCSLAKSSIEDQLSSPNKRRRIDTPLPRIDTESLSSSSSGGKMNIIPLIYNSNMMSNVRSAKDAINRPLPNSSICVGFSIPGAKVSQHKHSEPPAKKAKKKSKPRIRARPKDRQQVQDRLIELRELIPKAEKMSIDCLLHRTINHLLFLQSVAEHAESIKKLANSKQDRIVPPNISGTCHSGVTWACEVDDQTMVFPLVVEDLVTPGQMSIEIQCEEQGSFLEIVDIIRGLGLAILKGVMEAQEAKMSARFTVAMEGKNHVTRHEIFSSLVQHLQFTNLSGVSPSNQYTDAANGGVGLFDTWQQSGIPASCLICLRKLSRYNSLACGGVKHFGGSIKESCQVMGILQ